MEKQEKKYIQITAGKGPAECAWVVAQVLKRIVEDARKAGVLATVLYRHKGIEKGTLLSAFVALEGGGTASFLSEWVGTIQWVGKSKFRKMHKRKNWFIAVERWKKPLKSMQIEASKVKFDAFRAGGAGGQHVNKVNTAVRATYLPTGLSVVASDQRSQIQNKKLALERLKIALEMQFNKELSLEMRDKWQSHQDLERGNPVKTLFGSDFKAKHRKNKNKESRRESKLTLRNRNFEE